jgi:uncharacterized repeat protein (TIGR01451 family)
MTMETLEERRLLSAAISNNTLVVSGTGAADTISVQMEPNSTSNVQVTVDGTSQIFSLNFLQQITVNCAGGNDTVVVNPNIPIKTVVNAGTGDDTITVNSIDVVNPGSGESVVSTNGGNSFVTQSTTPAPSLPNVPGASSLMAQSMYVLGPNSLSAIGNGIISPVDTVGYNTLSDIEFDYGIQDPVDAEVDGVFENGSGQFIGIVDPYAGPTLTQAAIAADINIFSADPVNGSTIDGNQIPGLTAGTTFKLFGPSTTPTLSQTQEDDAATETLLDIEYAHAIAPDASIYLFQSPDLTVANLMATIQEAAITITNTTAGGGVISMSFGSSEFSTEYMYDDTIFSQYPTISFIASAGDTVEDVSYPAISPYVTSVGGTTLPSGPQIRSAAVQTLPNSGTPPETYVELSPYTPYPEFAWGNTTVGSEGGGGGVSIYEPAPTYQQGDTTLDGYPVESIGDGASVTPILTPNGNGGLGGTAITMRTGPDVAMVADPQTGVAVYLTVAGLTGWEEIGGTSLSAPLFAGVVTLANQQRTAYATEHHTSIGGLLGVNLNPAIYTMENQLYVLPPQIPTQMTDPGSSPLQNDGVRNGPYFYSYTATAGTVTTTTNFESSVMPGEFYNIGGLTKLTTPGPNQGGFTDPGLNASTGWGTPNVNYLVPFAADADSDFDEVDAIEYVVNLTNVNTGGLGQPIYVPNSPVDLVITKTADNLTPTVEGTVTYTVTISDPTGTNSNGVAYGDATGVIVDDLLPAGEVLDSAVLSAPGDTYANGVWTIPTLEVGGTDTLQIIATITAFGAPITNTATIAGVNQINDNTNLAASVTVNPQEVSLSVQDTVNNPTPLQGSDVIYTVTVTNAAGFSNATDISVSNPLPAGETLLSFAPSTASYVDGNWEIPSLAAGASTSLSYVAQVNALGLLVNTAAITGADQFDVGFPLSASNTIDSVTWNRESCHYQVGEQPDAERRQRRDLHDRR